MEKHKVLESRLREKTGIETLEVEHHYRNTPGWQTNYNFITITDIQFKGGDISNMSLDIPEGEDGWMKLEKKLTKLITALKD